MRKTVVKSARISKIMAVFAIFLISFLLFLLFSTTNIKSLYADTTGSTDANHPGFTFSTIGATATITAYDTGTGGLAVTIPDSVQIGGDGDPYTVTSIGNNAFINKSTITSISIPSGVTSIGNYAFAYCSGLTSITIPSSVTSIGVGAFLDDTDLTSISIPSTVTSIGDYAFQGCYNLISITLSEGLLTIGMGAFYGDKSLTSISIPNTVTSIGVGAFVGCTGLTSITIPSSVETIGAYAFEGCTGLASIDISEGVKSIGEGAFRNDISLTSITIPSTVTSIRDNAFLGDTSLTSITLPEGLTSIGNQAFRDCSNLETVTFKGEAAPTNFGTNNDSFLNIKSGAIANVPAGSIGTGYINTNYPFTGYYDVDGVAAGTLTLTESPGEDQAAPTGLAGVAPTSALTDGKITGTTTAMEYILASGGTYAACSATETTVPEAGNYLVRFAVKTGFNAGATSAVTVPAYSATDSLGSGGSSTPRPLTPEEIVALSLTMQQQINTYGASNTGFIKTLYDNILGRVPEDKGLNGWEANLNNTMTGSQVAHYFIFCIELAPTVNSLSDNNFIAFLYTTLMNRPYDEAGYAGWQEQMESGMTREELVNYFVNSPEFAGICTLFNVTP